jgi:methylated-DNA-[protein]-cysteine S-methyltransferase
LAGLQQVAARAPTGAVQIADELKSVLFCVGAARTPTDESSKGGSAAEDWGWMGLVASERGVRLLTLPRRTREAALAAIRQDYPDATLLSEEAADRLQVAGSKLSETAASIGPGADIDGILIDAQRQVQAYLEGDLREFKVPLDLRGNTSFALSVWATASRIPYSQTRTYGWIARQVGGGGQGIFQAVGAALASNPIPLIIPCHRVVASDGSLHGYAGGLEMKTRLLALETGQARLLI